MFLLRAFAITEQIVSRWAPPRLITIPALLVLAALASVVFFNEVESLLCWELRRRHVSGYVDLARHRTRLVSSFVAINIFFWFADPTLGLWSGIGGQLVRSLVLVVTAVWLARGWSRNGDIYRRELLSISLRKQLKPFEAQLLDALDGRSLQELTASEVFLLARVLPGQQKQLAASIYRNVLEDMFRSGRLDVASALTYLQELRHSLGVDEHEHDLAVQELAMHDPRLMANTAKQQWSESLRMQAAKEAVSDLLDAGDGDSFLSLDSLTDRQRQSLLRIRLMTGLDDYEWSTMLKPFVKELPC